MNKRISLTTVSLSLVVAIISLLFGSCSEKEPSLGALPVPSFKSVALTPTSDLNAANIELINTTPTSSIAYWNVPGVGMVKGDTVQVAFVFAGDYPVTLYTAGQGGLDSCTQTINVAQDNPYAVGPTTLLGVLTGASLGNTERTWMASLTANACVVWDTYTDVLSAINGGGGAWWGNSIGDATLDGGGRTGYFDDKYTFTFGNTGQLIYDDNNSVFLDGSSGWVMALQTYGGAVGNFVSNDVYSANPSCQPWASGTFTYSIASAPAGVMKLGQITVHGVGAHFGMQDKANGSDQTVPTVPLITYDVLQIKTDQTDAKGTYDQIDIGINDGNWWGFSFRSYR